MITCIQRNVQGKLYVYLKRVKRMRFARIIKNKLNYLRKKVVIPI
jgi:hypothetical protein